MTAEAHRPSGRWPVALAVPVVAGAVVVIAVVDRQANLFGPAVATMAGIYLIAYAVGRPVAAWPAFAVLSVVATGLHLLAVFLGLPAVPAAGMTLLLVPLWLWAVARRRHTEGRTFTVQTAGMVGFGVIAVLTAVTQPDVGTAVAGVGFLAHGVWDVYHFRADQVVSRSWSQFCAAVDVGVGIALLVAAAS
jgi:hypothetical protein